MSNLIKRVITLLTIAIIFMQCGKTIKPVFTPADLTSEFFSIPVNKDTEVHTSKGAIIKFANGSLNAGGAATARIEIKEAYTVADMLRGGLITRAGKDPLSSGGMIYINAADGNVTLAKPIAVKIPTEYHSERMQLYSGDERPDGTIDWVDPQSLPKQELDSPLAKGRDLFMANCNACHYPTKAGTGPPLAFLDQRRDANWLYHFIHNSQKMVAYGDPIARCLYKQYNGTVMTPFPDLSEEDITLIFKYVNTQAANPDAIPDFKKSVDSCYAARDAQWLLYRKRDSLLHTNGKAVVTEMFRAGEDGIIRPNAYFENGPIPKPENLVRPGNENAVYYQFSIKSLGWYNVDELMDKVPGFEECFLTAKPTGAISNINMFLLLPSHKVFLRGGLLKEKDNEYGFYTDDGKIQLPLNTKAILLAVSEDKGSIHFGKLEFVTSRQQTLEVSLSATSKVQMNDAIKKLDLEGITISALDSKNADSIRKVDLQIEDVERLKPRNCDCKCIEPPAPEIDSVSEK
jgi:mono/diheme cytochrome c family protein